MAETNPSSILATAQTIFGDGFNIENYNGGRHVDEDRLRQYYKTGGAHSTTGVRDTLYKQKFKFIAF